MREITESKIIEMYLDGEDVDVIASHFKRPKEQIEKIIRIFTINNKDKSPYTIPERAEMLLDSKFGLTKIDVEEAIQILIEGKGITIYAS